MIEVEREGHLLYWWRAFAPLRRGRQIGNLIEMPTGRPTTLDQGYAFTSWGARRKARRAMRRWA